MPNLSNMPVLIFLLSFIVLWLATFIGARVHRETHNMETNERDEFGIILGATLTLLGLIIGFTFSMAISRYDQRKLYEEEEANAIGTEYVRVDVLPASDVAKLRSLLRDYINQRIRFYETRDETQQQQINLLTAQLQNELWTSVQVPASARPTPVTALAVSGMNDVLNSQGYTQASWWNRIPVEAWYLMGVVAICSNFLLGYQMGRSKAKNSLLLVLPIVLSVSFSLIADIDSPRAGLIRIRPQNLLSLSQSLHP